VTSRRRFPLTTVASFAVPILFFLSLVAWSFASPVGSSPDDNFHLASIWCGLGDRDGLCEQSGNADTRLVPAPVVNAPCYAYHPEQSAACWNSEQDAMAEATWMNASGLYPRLFYATMGVFASEDVVNSVLIMRVFNSALVVGLLTGVFYALPRRIRPALVISAVVTAVPLGLFIIASTNPSAWAYVSAAVVWAALYGSTQSTGRRQILLTGLAVLGACLGAGARADAAAFAIFGVVLAGVLGVRRGVRLIVPAIGAVVIFAVSVGFYLSADQTSALTSGLPNTNPPLTGAQHVANFFGVPSLWLGAFGDSGLGWLDTALPAAVPVFAFAAFCGAIFIGIHRPDVRRSLAAALAFAACWLVPFVLLAQSHAVVGTIVQPRYVLPLLVILAGVASLRPTALDAWTGARSLIIGSTLTGAATVAMYYNIRRYTVGAGSIAIDPGAGAEWWWGGAVAPSVVWIGGSMAFAAACVLLWFVVRATRTPLLSDAVADGRIDRSADTLERAAPSDSDQTSR
jgi:hypothetical protein